MGVSRVTGRMAVARQLSGRPDPEQAKLLVKWCTAAFGYHTSDTQQHNHWNHPRTIMIGLRN